MSVLDTTYNLSLLIDCDPMIIDRVEYGFSRFDRASATAHSEFNTQLFGVAFLQPFTELEADKIHGGLLKYQ